MLVMITVVRHKINDSHTLNSYIEESQEVVEDVAGSRIKVSIVSENLMVNQAAESLMVAQIKALDYKGAVNIAVEEEAAILFPTYANLLITPIIMAKVRSVCSRL